jgi:outer membrane protein assembly factor BamB
VIPFLRRFSLPILILALLAAAALWLRSQSPLITSIPAVQPGAGLVILGQHFGSRQGSSTLSLLNEPVTGVPAGQPALLQVTTWSDTRIIARLPQGVNSGRVQVTTALPLWHSSPAHAFLTAAPGLPSQPYGYTVPAEDASPWPTFRRDAQNSGRSPLPAVYQGDQLWSFQTSKGIFNTPVIDANGAIYIGSADHYLYALNPDGSLKWKYLTGGIIDSAGALGRFDAQKGYAPLTFISGDGYMYNFRTDDGIADPAQRLVWKYQAELRPGVSYNRWFEGNVAIGPDGTLYAGNTNFNYYAVNPDGTLKWTYSTTSNNWSQSAFAADGTIYWGSLDTFIHAVAPDGQALWSKRTLGFVAASAAVGSDGTVYIGSFDSNLYALDPLTGKTKWTFPTNDHIYSSAALGADAQGNTTAIYFGSADGAFYAVSPQGKLLWKYDTGDPIRSSPAIGLTPQSGGSGGEVVYFGCGNGKLYALNAADGSLRWSFDTTPTDPELRDRNDLNGSPALGKTGIYIGGEHGYLWYLPYDYCLHAANPDCAVGGERSAQPPADFTGLEYVTPGGSTLDPALRPASLPTAMMITLRLVVRQGGLTLNAGLCNNPVGCPQDALVVSSQPPFPLSVEHSADGRYIFIRPTGFLTPGQAYSLSVKGKYYTGGLRLGNMTFGGTLAGTFSGQFSFRAQESLATRPPLSVSPNQTSAIEWTRLAAPLPPMLPSLNQIGFDYMDWIIGTVAIGPSPSDGTQNQGKFILWAIGGVRQADGTLAVEPGSDFSLPLNGRYQNDDFILTNQNFKLAITGIDIPFNLFELRGRLGADRIVRPGATAWGDTQVLSIPTFGPYLVAAGLANNWYQKLLVSGTYITRPYPDNGTANQRPSGISVTGVDYQAPTDKVDGWAQANFKLDAGASYAVSSHQPGILLIDGTATEAVYLDYHANLSSQADPQGNLKSVRLVIPKGTKLPQNLQAEVMLDVFPFYQKNLCGCTVPASGLRANERTPTP